MKRPTDRIIDSLRWASLYREGEKKKHTHTKNQLFLSSIQNPVPGLTTRDSASAPAVDSLHSLRAPVGPAAVLGRDVGPCRARKEIPADGTPPAVAAHGPTSPNTARLPDRGGLWVSGQGRAANRYFPALLASRCPREQPRNQAEFVSPVRPLDGRRDPHARRQNHEG
jgi:hypothetical protein